jgi:hypothetical protein
MSLPCIAFVVFLCILIFTLVYYVFKFALIIINLENSIEEALDELDQSYTTIAKILEKPLFFDSQEVRSVLNEIKRSQSTILFVANLLAQIENVNITEKDQ